MLGFYKSGQNLTLLGLERLRSLIQLAGSFKKIQVGMGDTSTKISIPILYVLDTLTLSTFRKNQNFDSCDHMIFCCKRSIIKPKISKEH